MLPVSTLVSLLAVILFNRRLGVVVAQMVPTTPGPGETYTAGADCAIAWVPDPTGTWNNVTIDLMSGSNNDMSLVTNVVSGLDGTDASLTPSSWTCPEVDPYSPIYFYQFTNGDDISTRTWTTRFTIASPADETELPENVLQPDGQSIPWGVGHLTSSKLAANLSLTSGTGISAILSQTAVVASALPSAAVSDSNSTTQRHGKKPHGRKGNETDTGDDDGQNDGDEDGESTRKHATRTHSRSASATGSESRSAGARTTAVAHDHKAASPDDSDASSAGDADSDPDSESEYQAQSPLSNANSNPGYKNSGAADAADSARVDSDGTHANENAARSSTQLEFAGSTSGVFSTMGPSLIIALLVFHL